MEGSRDSTQDWLLPDHAAPPTIGELEQRIDQALVIARSSERAAVAIGDAALDAAAQARRAAELAERATAAALSASQLPGHDPLPVAGPPLDAALRSFSERADRVVARLRALERRPRRVHPASAAAGGRRPGG